MSEVLFETKGVGKTYGSNTVLHDIDMNDIERAKVYT